MKLSVAPFCHGLPGSIRAVSIAFGCGGPPGTEDQAQCGKKFFLAWNKNAAALVLPKGWIFRDAQASHHQQASVGENRS